MKEKTHLAKALFLAAGILIALFAMAVPFASAQQDNSMQDMAFWSAIMDSDNPALFEAYLQKFPDGAFTLMAHNKLKTLGGKPASTVVPTRSNGADLRKRAKENYPIDLDGNGSIEEVLLVPSGRTEFGQYYSLAVLDDNGGVIWAGPTTLNEEDPLVFGEWDFGISMPELVADLELDGAVELIAPAMQSDVSPTFFRVLRWDNNAFKPVRTAMLIQKPGSREFIWTTGEQPTEGIWVSGFRSKGKPGEFTVGTMEWGNGDVKMRQALLWSVSVNGYVVHRWLDDKKDKMSAPMPDSNKGAEQLLQQADEIMSQAYRESDDTRRNNQAANALTLYRKAAEMGSAKAHYNIGFLYEIGTGIAKNNDTAIRYYEKAALGGYLEAYPQIILVQNHFRNYHGAAKTFLDYYRADPVLALAGVDSHNPSIVRAVQSILRTSGHYHGPLDGDVGPATRAAIAAYIANGLPHSANQTVPSGNVVINLQRQLQRVGCYLGEIDGIWGGGSTRALRNFNHWAGKKLPTGHPTWQALQAVSAENREICSID